jgi:hypothetical protein
MSTTQAPPTSAPLKQAPEITRHLVIVCQPGWQNPEDFQKIGLHVRRIDPTIGVFVFRFDKMDPAAELAAGKPSLVFSPGPLGAFKDQRGARYSGVLISKLDELRRLAAAGVPVPRTTVLTPGLQLDPAMWGERVLIKPTDLKSASTGAGVRLVRTEDVGRVAPTAEAAQSNGSPMLVQEFIDTGPHLSHIRILTLFGRPLMMARGIALAEHPPLDVPSDVLADIPVASHSIERRIEFFYNADLAALARRAHEAIPEAPLKGVDIMMNHTNGRLYVLETNPKSNTWHFSSQHAAATRQMRGPEHVRQMHQHLDAFGTAAHTLADVTRREAV